MRVTESLLFNQLSSNITISSNNYQALQQELATGRRINQPSDDPNGTNQALTMRAILVNINQYQTDINSANSFLSYTDTQLNSTQQMMQQARTIAVATANGSTMSSDSQAAYAAQVQSIIDQVTTIANSDLNGRRIFAGQQTNLNPYNANDPTHAYHGDTGALTATVGKNDVMQINIPGSQVFSPQFSALEKLKSDITAGNWSAISNADIPAVDAALSSINQARAGIGVKINQLTDDKTRLGTTQQNYQNQLSNVEDVDIATVYAQLQVAQNVYQASLVTTSRALQYSLAEYLH